MKTANSCRGYLLPCNLSSQNNLQFRCYEAKLEESEKTGSHRESNPGHLWLEPPVLYMPLSHNSQTTTSPHNTLLNDSVAHRPPLSTCHQNSVRGRIEISLHQERTYHVEWSTHSKCSEYLASHWK